MYLYVEARAQCWESFHHYFLELKLQLTGWAESLKSLPMGRKHGRGLPTPQSLGGASRNMLGQRPAGTPRDVGNGRLLAAW